MDWDLEGLSRGFGMTSMQTVPCLLEGMLALSCWKRIFFQQSDKFAGHASEGLYLHRVSLYVTLNCYANKIKLIQSKEWTSFLSRVSIV